MTDKFPYTAARQPRPGIAQGNVPRLALIADLPHIVLLDIDLLFRADPNEHGEDLMTSLATIFRKEQ